MSSIVQELFRFEFGMSSCSTVLQQHHSSCLPDFFPAWLCRMPFPLKFHEFRCTSRGSLLDWQA